VQTKKSARKTTKIILRGYRNDGEKGVNGEGKDNKHKHE
jgi:hypothetical protein